MAVLFVYMLKSAFCLAVLFLFYRLLLSRETFHRFNRIALLSLFVLSCIVPLMEISLVEVTTNEQPFTVAKNLPVAVSSVVEGVRPVATFSWTQVILLVYLLGVVFFLLRFVWAYLCMWQLVRSCTLCRVETDGVHILTHTDNDIAPFSWLHFIVLSENDLATNGRAILLHERAHVRARHTLDCLVADICVIFQWFNPAAWLLMQELRNIHEYEADESVLAGGVDAKTYQLLLIKKAAGTRLYSMANSLNHSSLKKRITMMMRKKSSPWARAKYLCVLPLVAVSAAALAHTEVSNLESEFSACKVSELLAFAKAEDGKSKQPRKKEKDRNQQESNPMIIVDGKKYDFGDISLIWKALNLEDVDSVEIITDGSKVNKHYPKAKHLIIITTKKAQQ